MGMYWTTIFYRNAADEEGIVVSKMDQIIEDSDTTRGYILKEEVLDYFKKIIKPEDIGEESYMVEYFWDTYGDNPDIENEYKEVKRLPVK